MNPFKKNLVFKPAHLDEAYTVVNILCRELGYTAASGLDISFSSNKKIFTTSTGYVFYQEYIEASGSDEVLTITNKDHFLALAGMRTDSEIHVGEYVKFIPNMIYISARNRRKIAYKVKSIENGFVMLEGLQSGHPIGYFEKAIELDLSVLFTTAWVSTIQPTFPRGHWMAGVPYLLEKVRQSPLEIHGTKTLKDAFLRDAHKKFKGQVEVTLFNNRNIYLEANAVILYAPDEQKIKPSNPNISGAKVYYLSSQYGEALDAIADLVKPKVLKHSVDTHNGSKVIEVTDKGPKLGEYTLDIEKLRKIESLLSQAEGVMIGSGIQGKAFFTFGCKNELQYVPTLQISKTLTVYEKIKPSAK